MCWPLLTLRMQTVPGGQTSLTGLLEKQWLLPLLLGNSSDPLILFALSAFLGAVGAVEDITIGILQLIWGEVAAICVGDEGVALLQNDTKHFLMPSLALPVMQLLLVTLGLVALRA